MSLTRTFVIAAALAAQGQAAGAATITVTRADCMRIVRHAPAPDVAYRPGVDVRGRAVAPADLAGGPVIETPKAFAIDITIDLRERLGIPPNPKFFKPEASIGTVHYRDGKAWFNGQPLATEGLDTIARICRERLRP